MRDEDKVADKRDGRSKMEKMARVQYDPARLLYSVKRDARLNTNTDIGFRKTLKQ